MTSPYRRPAGYPGNRQAVPPPDADPKTGEKDQAEVSEPYDLPDPEDQWPPGRPAYLIVVDQLRDWQPDPIPVPGRAPGNQGQPAPANPNPTWKPNHDPDHRTTPMPLTITDDLITSDRTAHTARPVPGHPNAWQVTWLPGQTTSPSGAVTAMMLADAAARGLRPGHRIWPHISGWAAELGLTAPAAVALASAPPPDKAAGREPAASTPGRRSS